MSCVLPVKWVAQASIKDSFPPQPKRAIKRRGSPEGNEIVDEVIVDNDIIIQKWKKPKKMRRQLMTQSVSQNLFSTASKPLTENQNLDKCTSNIDMKSNSTL